jgi:hypothetical protein
MNPKLLAIDIDPGAFWHVRKVSKSAILHFDYHIISFHEHNLAALDRSLNRGRVAGG